MVGGRPRDGWPGAQSGKACRAGSPGTARPEFPRLQMRLCQYVRRGCEDTCVDASATPLPGHLQTRASQEEGGDRRFPVAADLRRQRRAIVSEPVDAAQRVASAGLIHPVRQRLVRGRTEATRHERMETPAVRELPDTTDGAFPVIDGTADSLELAMIELPHQYAADIAAESDFLSGHIDML